MTLKNALPAVAKLEGLTLESGWKVIAYKPKDDHHTGGHFSHSYIVEKEDQKGFLKAFDFTAAFEAKDTIAAMQELTTAYKYERDLLLLCNEKRLRKVVVAIDHGEVQVPDFDMMSGRVYYLIFHLADGDVRGQVKEDERLDTAWCVRALKDVTTGLFQVHRQMIAHQDLKPSNVLIFGQESRIADFGRASLREREAVHDKCAVAGDHTYAPPEQLYGHCHADFAIRRFGCDFYMLGNLASFLLTGINVTSHIFARLNVQFHYTQWQGTYADVLPYIQESYSRVMVDIEANMCPNAGGEMVQLIKELCEPDLSRRGHPKGLGRFDQFSLERYVSRFDVLLKKVELRARSKRRMA